MTEIDFHRREFTDGEELAVGLADWTSARLRAAIAARGAALLIVSGGKSPARFFDLLSNVDLDWTRVAINPCRRAACGRRQPPVQRATRAREAIVQPRKSRELHAARRCSPR